MLSTIFLLPILLAQYKNPETYWSVLHSFVPIQRTNIISAVAVDVLSKSEVGAFFQ